MPTHKSFELTPSRLRSAISNGTSILGGDVDHRSAWNAREEIQAGKGRDDTAAEDQFTAAATAGTSGPMRVFAGGQGTSAARGTMSAGQQVAGGCASSIIAGQKSDEVRLLLSAGTVKD